MMTKSAENNIRKAIKARLKLNNKQISEVLALNWNVPVIGDMKDCIAVCEPKADVADTYELLIMMKDRGGYYTTVQVYNLKDEHVARWKLLTLEEAYALPADYAHRGSSGVWHDATITNVGTDVFGFIHLKADVSIPGVDGTESSVETHTLRTEEYDENVDTIDAIVGKTVSLFIDMNPPKTEKDILSGKDPLPLVLSFGAAQDNS